MASAVIYPDGEYGKTKLETCYKEKLVGHPGRGSQDSAGHLGCLGDRGLAWGLKDKSNQALAQWSSTFLMLTFQVPPAVEIPQV